MIFQEKIISKMKIAYIPYEKFGKNLTFDKRNILLYAKLKKIKLYKFNQKKKYDYILLPPSFDITQVDFIKKRDEFIIGQLVDNYLEENNLIKNYFRGVIKFFLGQQKKISFNYNKDLRNYLSNLDLVICHSDQQYRNIKKINKKVFKFFEGNFHVFNKKKKSYKKNKEKILTWEGRAENINQLNIFYDIFKYLNKKISFNFHIFTDYYYSSFSDKFIKINSLKIIKKIFKELFELNTTFKKSIVFFNQWNLKLTPIMISESDLFLIPHRTNNKFNLGRSSNKLILAMRMGVPVLTSDLPSYKSISKLSGVDFCCSSKSQWKNKILKYLNNPNLAKKNSLKLYNYVNKYYGKKSFLMQYDFIFSRKKI